MEAQEKVRRITREEALGSVALWFAVLASPAAWLGHLVVNYALEEWFACSPSAVERGRILGYTVESFSLAFNSAMLALAIASGLVAFFCLRRLPKDEGDDTSQRARWMAFAGMVEAALFAAIIIVGYAPPLLLGICEVTP